MVTNEQGVNITLQALAQVVRDSLERAMIPCENGWRLVYSGTIGDLKFMKELYNMEKNYSCDAMCWHCQANRANPGLTWTDNSEAAAWRATMTDTATFLAEQQNPCTLTSLRGWSLDTVYYDCLHVIFTGIGPDAIGTCMIVLVWPLDTRCLLG